MDIAILLVFLISVWRIRLVKTGTNDYLSKEQTSSINGVFVMLVFLHHFGQYISYGKFDYLFRNIDWKLDQLIVTTFLFYSGYGIAYSLKNKVNYLRYIPKRALKILIRFDIAVIIYLVVGLLIGSSYSFKQFVLSLVGWESIGNSNWYILAMLCLYLITYVSGLFVYKKDYKGLTGIVCIGCCVYIVFFCLFNKPVYCFNTIFCYPLGLFWGLNYEIINEKINCLINRKKSYSIAVIVGLFVLFVFFFKLYHAVPNELVQAGIYEIVSILFVLFIIFVTLFIKVGNPVLTWLGSHVFEIYILQRLPMIVFERSMQNKYIYLCVCLIITIALALIFKTAENLINHFKLNHKK